MHEKSAQTGQTAGLLFLREDELRLAQDMIFFANRDLVATADAMLAEMGFGRAHHRTLHFIGRNPGLPVGELLHILGIAKQSLARVLGPLIREGYVKQTPGRTDRRQRLLSLTPEGVALERRLFETQHERLTMAFREAGGPAVEGFRKVLRGMMKDDARAWLDRAEAARASKR
ncbi:MarR family winged helix-turn-helix transcriptional regulator [Acidiphilium sp.]|uniref:MarR family winged helix-turn-helix transcriptional regulator n=1 Tax=Acidiphilium sp. TaxID=527 RepID=UPI003D014DE2